MERFYFKSFDEELINYYEWKPKKSIKGVVQIIHGLQEHGLRYKDFAEFLAGHGYIVVASDQRLHGLTAGNSIGKTSIKDVFPVMVKDQMLIADMLLKKYNKPLVIMGHSYGSFETQSILQKYNKQAGTIICGSGYMKRPDTLAGKIFAESFVNLKGGETSAKEVEDIVIGMFNKPFKGNGNWISASKENLKKYEEDPLCGNALCGNFYASMFKNIRLLYDDEDIEKIDKSSPILIVSGKDDPVGRMGKSTTKLYEFYKSHGLNVQIKLYEGMRHEIINENNKEIVYQDLLVFIENCTKQTH